MEAIQVVVNSAGTGRNTQVIKSLIKLGRLGNTGSGEIPGPNKIRNGIEFSIAQSFTDSIMRYGNYN